MLKEILANVQEESGECSRRLWEITRRFWKMFKEILGDVQKDSGECKFRFTL